MKHIAIIGWWPAGLMTAATILEATQGVGCMIHLFEGNKRLWQKLLISGGGRCNVTTGIFDMKTLQAKYVRGWDFFAPALQAFGPKKTKKWFESHGVPLKTQDDNRVFPVSDRGEDILGVFTSIFARYPHAIQLHFSTKIQSVAKSGDQFTLSAESHTGTYDILVIATGGNAYAHTGSRGDGYAFAWDLGHTITQLWPSLSSFLVAEEMIKRCSGIALSDAALHFSLHGVSECIRGDLLLTHFGISWPLAFMLASHLAWEDIAGITVSLVPIASYSAHDWNQFLQAQFHEHPKRLLSSILKERLSGRLAEEIVSHFVPAIRDTFVSGISRKEREYVAGLLGSGIPLTLLSRRPWDEFVTAWWVETDELHADTLESKQHASLYFAGEILNIDGYTGGFSLQICWSTGYRVAQSIISHIW